MSAITGSCMCEAVTFTVTEELSGVVNCHCKDCQRLHGIYNPMVVIDKTSVDFADDAPLAWYDSSEEKSRGFCKECGSAMFMRQNQGPKMLISAGCLDDTSGLKTIKNIFTDEAGDYYVTPEEEEEEEVTI